jgi:hypothetical protein
MTLQNCRSSAVRRADLRGERGEKVALQTVEDRGQIEHVLETISAVIGSKPSAKNPNKTEF